MSNTNVDTLSRLFLQIYQTNPFFLSAFDSLDFYLVYIKVVPTCTDFVPLLIVRGLGKHYLHSKDYPISVDRRCHDGYTELYRYDRRNYSLYRSLNSQWLQFKFQQLIHRAREKVVRPGARGGWRDRFECWWAKGVLGATTLLSLFQSENWQVQLSKCWRYPIKVRLKLALNPMCITQYTCDSHAKTFLLPLTLFLVMRKNLYC